MAERGTRRLFGAAIAAAALLAIPATAGAQETQRTDTAAAQDTAAMGRAQMDSAGQDTTQWGYETNKDPEVQNPPGYRGMERPVNVFPPDSGADSAKAGRVEDRATGTYDDTTWNDTTGAQQNPAGYRGMERPVGGDTSSATGRSDTSSMSDTSAARQPADTGSAAAGARTESDTGSMAGNDSASVRPGETKPVKKDKPSKRLESTDSAGTGESGHQDDS